jgi:hypothetical protein
MPRPAWPWRSDPGKNFNSIATFARITAGFEHKLYGVDDSEYITDPELIARDLTLVLVMATRRAKRAGVELDFENLIDEARAEVERWEKAQHLPPEPV